jgi:chitin disaccharide deacetylase
VIVNADDLGLLASVNDGIFDAIDAGIVSDASLMAVGEAFDHAVEGLARRGRTAVGLHVCLVDGEAPLAEDDIVAPLLRNGRLVGRNELFLKVLRMPRRIRPAIEAEVLAQFAKVRAAGLRISHVDSHQHAHLFPVIAEIVVAACRAHDVRYLRLPVTRVRSYQTAVVAALSWRLSGLARRAGLQAVPSLGFECSGRMSATAFRSYTERASRRGAEIMVHPGRGRSTATSRYGHWRIDWDAELQALRDGATAGLRPVSYEGILDASAR